jgi:hypothetical protein
MQLKIKEVQLQQQRLEFVHNLMEQKRLNTAKIIHLQAQAAAAMAGIDAQRAATQLSFLQAAMDTILAHNKAITERISALSGMSEGEGEDEASGGNEDGGGTTTQRALPALTGGDQGGIPGMEGGPGDEGSIPADEALEGEPEGAME